MPDTPFAIEYYLNGENFSQQLQDKLESRLAKLAKGHRDITGASFALTRASEKPLVYQARLVLYHRPDQIVGVAKSDNIGHALAESLEAVQRQVRSQRDAMRDRKRHQDPNPAQLAPDMIPEAYLDDEEE